MLAELEESSAGASKEILTHPGLVVVESGLQEGDLIALHDPNRPLRPAGDDGAGGNGVAGPVAGAGL